MEKNEKMVSLNEDSKQHEHDTTSFDRLAKQQEDARKQMQEQKQNK